MAKKRVYEIAKEKGLSSKDLLERAAGGRGRREGGRLDGRGGATR